MVEKLRLIDKKNQKLKMERFCTISFFAICSTLIFSSLRNILGTVRSIVKCNLLKHRDMDHITKYMKIIHWLDVIPLPISWDHLYFSFT